MKLVETATKRIAIAYSALRGDLDDMGDLLSVVQELTKMSEKSSATIEELMKRDAERLKTIVQLQQTVKEWSDRWKDLGAKYGGMQAHLCQKIDELHVRFGVTSKPYIEILEDLSSGKVAKVE